MRSILWTIIMAAAIAAAVVGCSTTQRDTKNKDGTTTRTKQSSLFIQVQGYDDSIDANGAQHTSIANFSTDAQGIMAMDNLLNNLMGNIAKMIMVANAGTNGISTNAMALFMQRQQPEQPGQVTVSRHLYRAPK